MKKMLSYVIPLLLVIGISNAEESSSITNSSTCPTSVVNFGDYKQIKEDCEKLVAQTTPPSTIEIVLKEAIFIHPLLNNAAQADWPEIRAKAARNILGSLFQLEDGIRQTAAITNMHFRPPRTAAPLGVPLEYIKDPVEREQMRAYGAMSKPNTMLWNMRQRLLALRDGYWDESIKLLVKAYSIPPVSDVEIRQLIEMHPGYECTGQFSNQFYQVHHK